MAQQFYIGLDGGGTNSRARLTDGDGHVLGEGVSGSSNLTLGADIAAASIRAACDAALAASTVKNIGYAQIHAGFGLAGANVPELAAALQRVPFGFASMKLASDAVIACLGAHGGADGAILILGTGSQGLALLKGEAKTIGGWGFLVGDDGSGAQLGRAAIRAALRAHEGWGPASPLTARIMARFNANPSEMVIWAAQATPRDYGHFAPLVLEARSRGDMVAQALIAQSLAHVSAMIAALVVLGASRVALMGGLAQPYEEMLPGDMRAHLVRPQADALQGAILLARGGAKP